MSATTWGLMGILPDVCALMCSGGRPSLHGVDVRRYPATVGTSASLSAIGFGPGTSRADVVWPRSAEAVLAPPGRRRAAGLDRRVDRGAMKAHHRRSSSTHPARARQGGSGHGHPRTSSARPHSSARPAQPGTFQASPRGRRADGPGEVRWVPGGGKREPRCGRVAAPGLDHSGFRRRPTNSAGRLLRLPGGRYDRRPG